MSEWEGWGAVGIVEVRLSIPGDIDGSARSLRGWLEAAPLDSPWYLLPEAPSPGQGLLETVGVSLDSAAAIVALYDRVRLWMQRRQPEVKPVTAVGVVEIGDVKYELVVTLEPREADNGQTP
jgi:hypothetical protein